RATIAKSAGIEARRITSEPVVHADAQRGAAVDGGAARIGEARDQGLDRAVELELLHPLERDVDADRALEAAAVADAVAHAEEGAERVVADRGHRLLVLVDEPEFQVRPRRAEAAVPEIR